MTKKNNMPPMTLPTTNNNKKFAAKKFTGKKTQKKCRPVRINDRTIMYVDVKLSTAAVEALIERYTKALHWTNYSHY